MGKHTEFAMVHPALTLPGLWSPAQGRGNRALVVSGRNDVERREKAIVPQSALGLDVAGNIGDVRYRLRGPRRPTQAHLSYLLALIANARPSNDHRIQVDLRSRTVAAQYLRPLLPANFHQAELFGIETDHPMYLPAARTSAPETCSLETLIRDAGKSPDSTERAAFLNFVDTVSATTLTVTTTGDGGTEIVGGIPVLMFRLTGTCIELWLNPLQSKILGDGGRFARVSLAERNHISGDAAKTIHFIVSARAQRGRWYSISHDQLLATLYADAPGSAQEAHRRRAVLGSILRKIEAVGWTVRDQPAGIQLMRPKSGNEATEI